MKSRWRIFGVTVGIFLLGFLLQQTLAPILGEPPSWQADATALIPSAKEDFSRFLQKKDIPQIENMVQFFEGATPFLETLRSCKILQNVHTISAPNGFWLSFLCAQQGDSLHQFSGFFNTQQQHIFWNTPFPQSAEDSASI